jgi:O-antigen ligase
MIVVVVAALIAAAVFIVPRPQRGLLLLAALTPLNGLLPIVPVSVPPWWKEALLLVTLASAAYGARHRMPARLNVPWWPAMAAIFVFGSVSAVLAFGTMGAIPMKITFCYLLVVVVLWLAPFTPSDRDRLVTIVMAVGTLNAVYGVVQQFLGTDRLINLGYQYGLEIRSTGDMLRSFGTFNQPFGYALFLMLTILIGLAVALADPRRRRSQVFFWLLPFLLVGMIVSVVRASYLGLVLGMVFMGVLRYRKALAALGAVLLAVVPAALLLLPRGTLSTVLSGDSLATRADGWGVTWALIVQHPLGAGLGSAGSAAQKIVTDALQLPDTLASRIDGATAYSLGLPYQPDNYYIKLLVELGPIGLWLFVMFLAAALLSTTKVAQFALTDADSALAVGVGAVLVAAAAASFVSTYLEIFPMDFYTWLLLGAVGCIPLWQNTVHEDVVPLTAAAVR